MHYIFEELPFGILFWDYASEKVSYCNKRLLEMLNLNEVHLDEALMQTLPLYIYFRECRKTNKNINLENINIRNCAFNIVLNPKESYVEVYLTKTNETSEFQGIEQGIALQILRNIPYITYVIDTEGNFIFANNRGEEKLERLFKGNRRRNLYELLDMVELYWEKGKRMIKEELNLKHFTNYNIPIQNVTIQFKKEGITRYFSLYGYPISFGKEAKGISLTYIDVTEEYMEREKIVHDKEKLINMSTELKAKCDIIEILRKREKAHLMHLKDVINNISEGLVVLNTQDEFNFCNKAASKILDIDISEFNKFKNITRRNKILWLDEPEIDAVGFIKKHLKDNKSIKNMKLKIEEYESGRALYINFNLNTILDKNDKKLYTIISFKDISEEKEQEIKIKQQSSFIKQVVNTLQIPVAVVNYPELEFELANKACIQLTEKLGYIATEKEMVGRSFINEFRKRFGESLTNNLISVGETGKPYVDSQYRIRCSNGEDVYYNVSFMPYLNEAGTVNRIHIYGMDITEMVKHNLELEKVTRMKDEFFTIISHELRTPLTIIYSSIKLATDIYREELTPNIEKILNRISQNSSRLLKLINNILDLSKAEAGFLSLNNSCFDVVYNTEDIVNLVNPFAESRGISLIFDTNVEEALITLDREKYEKIILNLLSNAIKFTPSGKKIIVALAVGKNNFYLSVKDEGIGIPNDKVDLIFDRYVQVNNSLSRSAEGTGIGLSLVKKMVELMDGSITVISTEGIGTEFIIKFDRGKKRTALEESNAMVSPSVEEKIHIEFSDIN